MDFNGNVEYNGEAFVYMAGDYRWKISDAKICKIKQLLHRFNYQDYEYVPGYDFATDFPSCISTVRYNDGNVKSIDHYLGHLSVDEGLILLEDGIEKLIGVKKYVQPQQYIFQIEYIGEYAKEGSYKGHVVSAATKEDALKIIPLGRESLNINGEKVLQVNSWHIKKIGKCIKADYQPELIMSDRI